MPDSVIIMRPSRKAFFYTGVFFLLVAGVSLLWILAFRLLRHNSVLVFMAGSFLFSLMAAGIADKKIDTPRRTRFRLVVLGLVTITSISFIVLIPLPITGVSIRVRLVPESTEFRLRQPVSGFPDVFFSVYKTRGATDADITFRLPRPIEGENPPISIYLGHQPQRLYYGRHFLPYDITRLSYGTDIFFFYIPLSVYEGGVIFSMAHAAEKATAKLINGHTVRIWRALDVIADAIRVRRDSDGLRILCVKFVWGMLFISASAIALWYRSISTRTATLRWVVENFLAG